MFTSVLWFVAVPAVIAVAVIALRGPMGKLVADHRGIALQTVIVMVVLLVIAGAVAGVLLSRGGEAVTELEDQELIPAVTGITQAECVALGTRYSWDHSGTPDVCVRLP